MSTTKRIRLFYNGVELRYCLLPLILACSYFLFLSFLIPHLKALKRRGVYHLMFLFLLFFCRHNSSSAFTPLPIPTPARRHEIYLDTAEPVEVFRYQVFSVTEVAPEHQLIAGIGSGHLRDDAVLAALDVRDDQRVTLSRAAAGAGAGIAAPMAAGAGAGAVGTPADFAAMMSDPNMAAMMQNFARMMQQGGQQQLQMPHMDWQSSCSRIFLGETPGAQPSYSLQKGAFTVCHACATTCFAHDPAAAEPRFKNDAIACQCCAVPGGADRECMFMVRVALGEEVAHAHAQQALRAQLFAAGAHFFEGRGRLVRSTAECLFKTRCFHSLLPVSCISPHPYVYLDRHRAPASQMAAQGAQQMAQRIASHADSVLQFEDEAMLAEARKIVPIEMLKQRARGMRLAAASIVYRSAQFASHIVFWYHSSR